MANEESSSQPSFRDAYNHAVEREAGILGYSAVTLSSDEKFSRITPFSINSALYQMFLAGANAALRVRETDQNQLELELKGLNVENDLFRRSEQGASQ